MKSGPEKQKPPCPAAVAEGAVFRSLHQNDTTASARWRAYIEGFRPLRFVRGTVGVPA